MRPTSPARPRRRARVLVASVLATFVTLRAWLAVTPDADFDVGAYNVHHLFTGLVVITLCGIPLALRVGVGRVEDALVAGFGVGLAMALDEWVYLIATDGSNASYLLPVSFWGAVVVIGLAVAYVLLMAAAVKGHGSTHEVHENHHFNRSSSGRAPRGRAELPPREGRLK
jgi:hypothetical protein